MDNDHTISTPGVHILELNCRGTITVSASNVQLDGRGHKANAVVVLESANHVLVENVESSNMVWKGDYGTVRHVTFRNSIVALRLCSVDNMTVESCAFYEVGVAAGAAHSSAILLQNCDHVVVDKCTIDGVVGTSSAHGITCMSSSALVRDTFFTDILGGESAQAVYAYDSDVDLVDIQQGLVRANVDPDHVRAILDHVQPARVKVGLHSLQVAHLDGVVPTDSTTLEILEKEHTWRDFRTLGRLVCHNALRSSLCRQYANWTVRFCKQVLGVDVVVENAFSNLYLDGNTPLPLHRDQYNKWIFGLSFGETRTLDFIADSNDEVTSYAMKHGDVLLFSPSVNEHYQHRMLAEPQRSGKRINITFFLSVDRDAHKLLEPLTDAQRNARVSVVE